MFTEMQDHIKTPVSDVDLASSEPSSWRQALGWASLILPILGLFWLVCADAFMRDAALERQARKDHQEMIRLLQDSARQKADTERIQKEIEALKREHR